MNAESLIGTVLGTCTLQKLIGQGGMGAVFLAQQSRPKRQVAVKVLLPMIPLTPDQLAAFLERFRRETDAAAALEHPNIMPVHEYGEANGLAYLVMPYISGGTLRDVLECEGPLPLAKAANCLEQLADAIDTAHARGVIHRDIKPANIMVTSEGRLLLGDFGLVKIVAEGQSAMVRLTGAGAPVGTPDYMAPEQVIGEDVDARADLYSLGILLFQMVTGTTPFRGETPMQIAAQHLRLPPPSPLMLRPDLPIRAEQVIQRAMAKKPADRYLNASDLANAFRQALLDAGIDLEPNAINGLHSGSTGAWRALPPKRQFEPIRQTALPPKLATSKGRQSKAAAQPDPLHGFIPETPAIQEEFPLTAKGPRRSSLLRTGKFAIANREGMPAAQADVAPALVPDEMSSKSEMPAAQAGVAPALVPDEMSSKSEMPAAQAGVAPALVPDEMSSKSEMPAAKADTSPATGSDRSGLLSRTGKFPLIGGNAGILAKASTSTAANGLTALSAKQPVPPPTRRKQSPIVRKKPTETLAELETEKTLDTEAESQKTPVSMNPTDSLKGVQETTVADQLDQSLIEEVPVTPQPQDSMSFAPNRVRKQISQPRLRRLIVIASLLAIFAVLGTLFMAWIKPSTPIENKPVGSSNMTATAIAHLTAKTQSNVILSDPLKQNTHHWYTDPPSAYAFKDGAYHITDDNDQNGRAGILSTNSFGDTIGYQLTMEEIIGNDANANNSFGMIFRFSQQDNKKNKNGDPIITFYSFEVVNMKGGAYYFWKYDNTNPNNPWTLIQDGKQPFGSEFHQGQGSQAVNTFKIFMHGNKFTVTVNGTTLSKTFEDASLTQGMVGMIVNLKGTEVAFSNLLITKS
jgi:serine/threonine protein kinase